LSPADSSVAVTEGLYLRDAYLREFEARVLADDGRELRLDRTAFYPAGGGQPADSGRVRGADGSERVVSEVTKSGAEIVHVTDPRDPWPPASVVRGAIDWDRRFAHMRFHTALHILSGVVFRRYGSGITGGQIYDDRARMDFGLPDFDRAKAERLIEDVNAVVAEDRPIHVRFISREEAQRTPSLVRVAAELMPDVAEVRLIDIEGFDVQADGGTHVRRTGEVGPVRLEKIENKGARNKRLYLGFGAPGTPGVGGPA
jgi:misacylated tRNA(Ala) deacylase